MLTREENELLTRTGPGTPMGALMRRYWVPALLSCELPEPDGDPKRLRLLGEDLVAFRDTQGRVGLLAAVRAFQAGEPPLGLDLPIPYGRIATHERIIPTEVPWETVAAFAGEPVPEAATAAG